MDKKHMNNSFSLNEIRGPEIKLAKARNIMLGD